jgi:glucosamine--fructose-6-phosphate aminotransferase (isomerizing)
MLGRGGRAAYPRPMDAIEFDPSAPLPGPPEPWASTDMPSHRDGPPFHMTEMIAAEPAIVARILTAGAAEDSQAARLASAVAETIRAGSPVVVTGCGTSEHGALGVVEIWREATGSHRITSAQAFELSLEPPSSGLVVGISHEGATGATNAALTAARAAGCQTALITVSARSPGAALADIIVETHELDQSWCHTVGYISPIAAGAAVAGHLTGAAIVATLPSAPPFEAAEAIAEALAGVDRVLVLGSGADRVAGRELVLKIEEGAWLSAAYRDLETFLHGHLAATDEQTAVVVIATDRRARDARLARVRGALAAARVIGMPTAAIVTAQASRLLPGELTSVGRIVVEEAPGEVPAAVASLLGSAMALQTLTEGLAIARGINPDPIHRDVDRYRLAADAADEAT